MNIDIEFSFYFKCFDNLKYCIIKRIKRQHGFKNDYNLTEVFDNLITNINTYRNIEKIKRVPLAERRKYFEKLDELIKELQRYMEQAQSMFNFSFMESIEDTPLFPLAKIYRFQNELINLSINCNRAKQKLPARGKKGGPSFKITERNVVIFLLNAFEDGTGKTAIISPAKKSYSGNFADFLTDCESILNSMGINCIHEMARQVLPDYKKIKN